MGDLKQIPLEQIRENKVALRDVDRDTEAYQELVDSIRSDGVINAINVREAVDEDTGESYYELIDGLHRYSASRDAGLDSIPAQVRAADDGKVLELQIMGNLHKIETKPSEYTAQLKRLLSMNPTMTISTLAGKLNKSEAWIRARLSLKQIRNETIQSLIDEGEICLTNAFALAKLPEDEQVEWVDAAQTETPEEFVNKVNSRVKEIRDAKRKGRDPAPAEFIPSAHMQKVSAIKEEADTLDVVRALIADQGIENPMEAATMALKWVLHLDPVSIAVQKDKWDAKQKEKAERKARAAEERKLKAAEKARAKAAEAEAEAEKAKEALGMDSAEIV